MYGHNQGEALINLETCKSLSRTTTCGRQAARLALKPQHDARTHPYRCSTHRITTLRLGLAAITQQNAHRNEVRRGSVANRASPAVEFNSLDSAALYQVGTGLLFDSTGGYNGPVCPPVHPPTSITRSDIRGILPLLLGTNTNK